MAKTTPAKIVPKKITPAAAKKPTPVKAKAKAPKEEIEDTELDTDEEEESEEEDEEPAPKLRSKAEMQEDESHADQESDYLRKYQYKKVNNIPMLGSVGGEQTDPDPGSKAEVMKNFLLKQPRVTVMIPLDPGSDPKVLHSVTRNGYRLDFPSNTYIEVPVSIAEMIRDSNNQTLAALSQFKVDVGSKKDDALN